MENKSIYAIRYHDICCGHRVVGHESKCRHLHGHNYRFHFKIQQVQSDHFLDNLGRVLDFSVIKSVLCEWLEMNWDHKTLIWEKDPKLAELQILFPGSIVVLPVNPTAENMAIYFTEQVAPDLLAEHFCSLVWLRIDETRKCSVEYNI